MFILSGTASPAIHGGALLGGWLAKALADAIAKTGVLNNFAIGQEIMKEI